ncbi:PPE domain-containing protein [Nocardia alni]|uniref:PPE domain-containing protein n=1 Tax=Nocardia alni TaxID=2815723 RepID=UPI001C24EA22|nr:PPE domain-containing protein [Nocardia alni]
MLEPPRPGFTGTVWEAIPPERLVHEVTTGHGATPMTEAGLAYSGLAAGLTEAATEFRAVLSLLGDAWASSSSADGLNQLAGLAGWLDRIAAAAQSNAEIAGRQATNYQLARTTVPQLAQVAEAIRGVENLVHGILPGALLTGLLDTAEHQADGLRQQVVRAMRSYETASEQLARPWRQDHAPEVSAAANLLAEHTNGTPVAAHASGHTTDAPQLEHAMSDLPQLDLSPLQTFPAAPTVPVGGEALAMSALPLAGGTPTAPVPTSPPALQQPMTHTPMMSPASAFAAPAAATAAHAPRPTASDAADSHEKIVVNAGFATAPAVLGAPAPRPEQSS